MQTESAGAPETTRAEGAQDTITFQEFSAFWPEHLWNCGWVTRVWIRMVMQAEKFGLRLVDDPSAPIWVTAQAIHREDFCKAAINRWQSPRDYRYKTGLGPASIERLQQFQQSLG